MLVSFCSKTCLVAYVLAACIVGRAPRSDAGENAKPTASSAETRAEFDRLNRADWRDVFRDPGTGDWHKKWFLDGRVGTVTNTRRGMELRAGPQFGNDADHMVLWTKQSFSGDLKIEYEYTRLDSETRGVTILYVQATGSGVGPYAKDITQWNVLRAVPSMRTYFNHMQTYHISYAAFPNSASSDDYIRARCYIPEATGLRGTDLTPDYFKTGLFKTGVPHKITVLKHGQELFMLVRNREKELLCHWKNDTLPPIVAGRMGLRHMYTRAARYRDFRIGSRSRVNELHDDAQSGSPGGEDRTRVAMPFLQAPDRKCRELNPHIEVMP